MLKWLKTSASASVKVELLTASACLEYALSETNKARVTKYGFLHDYKLTKYLVSPAKSLPLQYYNIIIKYPIL